MNELQSFNQRIINIFYEIQKNNEKDNKQKSLHWQKGYNNKNFNLENLHNFRAKNSLSCGLDDSHDNILTFNFYEKLRREIGEEIILNNLEKDNIGNSPFLYRFNKYYIDYNKLIHIHWFNDLNKNIFQKNLVSNFCEIGGGFGSFSKIILNNINIKLLSIDLPEANLMTTFYLKKNFPNKKFFLYDDYLKNNKLTKNDFDNNDIIILPPDLNIDEKIKIELFINTRSMMEMNYEIIVKYFKFIQNFSKPNTFFLNINRYEKDTVGYPIRIAEYPYDKDWDVVLSKPSFNQPWVHFLLTKRAFHNFNNNIFDELKRIKKLGKKYTKHNIYHTYLFKSIKIIFIKCIKKIFRFFFKKKFTDWLGKKIINIYN